MKDISYKYRISFLKGTKFKVKVLNATTREHARSKFQKYVDNMQAFTESGSEIFKILVITQLQKNLTINK